MFYFTKHATYILYTNNIDVGVRNMQTLGNKPMIISGILNLIHIAFLRSLIAFSNRIRTILACVQLNYMRDLL